MKLKTFIILIVIVLLFIWGHSLMPVDTSSSESTGLMQVLQSVLDFLHIPITLTEHFVRKLAHFTEHAVVGLILGLFTYPKLGNSPSRRDRFDAVVLPLVAGFFIGFIDETIQIFSGRGPMIQDVWIDFFGVFLGVGIAILIRELKRLRERRKASSAKAAEEETEQN